MLDQEDRDKIAQGLGLFAMQCAETAESHGWNDTVREPGTIFMLMVTELAEAFEEERDGNPLDYVYTDETPGLMRASYNTENPIPVDLTDEDVACKPEGQLVELADVLIRMMHFLQEKNVMYQFVRALDWKMRYNETRSYRHGGKTA